MLGQLRKLNLKARELSDLRYSLSSAELSEFDSKYGNLLAQIRTNHINEYDEWVEAEKLRDENSQKERADECKKREDERQAEKDKFANLMKIADNTSDKINSVFDKIIEAGNQAKSELEQCLVLEDFYRYYDISDMNDPEIGVKFANAIISKIESFGCDEYDYFENARSHFLKLLQTHPDQHVSTVSGVFTSLKNAQENPPNSENDQ
jgi:hypothetical protein